MLALQHSLSMSNSSSCTHFPPTTREKIYPSIESWTKRKLRLWLIFAIGFVPTRNNLALPLSYFKVVLFNSITEQIKKRIPKPQWSEYRAPESDLPKSRDYKHLPFVLTFLSQALSIFVINLRRSHCAYSIWTAIHPHVGLRSSPKYSILTTIFFSCYCYHF